MPLTIGSLTIIAPDGSEADDTSPLAELPFGAWRALTVYLYRRVIETADHICLSAPTPEQLRRWHEHIAQLEESTLALSAIINGKRGGISVRYAPAMHTPEHVWQVYSHHPQGGTS